MVNWKSRKLGDFLWLANAAVLVVLLNMVASLYFFRVDLTEEKRYSIKKQTVELLQSLEEEVYVEVFLEGELNAGFRRFRKSIEETLEEFRIVSGNKVRYVFTDPSVAMGEKARNEFMSDLAAKGIQPTNLVDKKNGQRVEKIIFPGAMVSSAGLETGVMLLKGNPSLPAEQRLNHSIEGIEFELANAIGKLADTERKRIGLVTGHGELDSLSVAALNNDLLEYYDVYKVDPERRKDLDLYDVLVVAKPTRPYSELAKFRIDQFIMNGGKVMFLIDKLEASMDSASREGYFAFPYNTNLDDQLFRYGVRINLDLVQDQQASLYPVVIGESGGKPQMQLLDWPFFPLISNYPDHPITRNLDAIPARFASSIDTVKAPGVRKSPLLMTSQYSRKVGAPVRISINDLRNNPPTDYTMQNIPVAYLLEGTFSSLYKNRFLPEGAESTGFVEDGKPSKIIVVADGDLARNEVNPRTLQPQPLGFDPYTNYTFANREFLLNAMAFLANENGLIQTRSKEVMVRPLDRERIRSEKTYWQMINIVLPLVILVVFGAARSIVRKRKYAKF